MKKQNRFKMAGLSRVGRLLCAVALGASSLGAQTNLLKVDYEWSDSVNGKWSKPPEGEAFVQPDGSLLTLGNDPQKFFRLNIRAVNGASTETPLVPVGQLPSGPVSIAESHLKWLISFRSGDGSEAPEGQPWANARLAPVAIKLFDYAYKEGKEPAYIEFKVISDFKPPQTPAPFLGDNESGPTRNLGHILVALHEGEDPVPEFSDEGQTPCEQLFQRLGNFSNLKQIRLRREVNLIDRAEVEGHQARGNPANHAPQQSKEAAQNVIQYSKDAPQDPAKHL